MQYMPKLSQHHECENVKYTIAVFYGPINSLEYGVRVQAVKDDNDEALSLPYSVSDHTAFDFAKTQIQDALSHLIDSAKAGAEKKITGKV